ncbi:MAG: hypothetical protein ABSF69_17755 [Polyangiaceae bacterium]|jgi:hypothetical protein
MIPLLSELTSQEFEDAVGPLLPPAVLRMVLLKNLLVNKIADAFQTGTVTKQNLRDFIRSEVAELRRGEPLSHDLALAALAVALEGSPSSFASEFISGLATLDIVEMQQSVFMAKECMKNRRAAPRTEGRSFQISPPPPLGDPLVETRVNYGDKRQPAGTFGYAHQPACAHASP